jgi:hypothetical protein
MLRAIQLPIRAIIRTPNPDCKGGGHANDLALEGHSWASKHVDTNVDTARVDACATRSRRAADSSTVAKRAALDGETEKLRTDLVPVLSRPENRGFR